MSVYSRLLSSVRDGKSYIIDLKRKNLKIGRKYYIKEGELLVDDNLIDSFDLCNQIDCFEMENVKDDPWEVISHLYQLFKHSIPNSKNKNNSKFIALPIENLTDYELASNYQRYYMQAVIEGYILLAGLADWIVWENENHWFWQSEIDKDCIVLKEWL